jgi:hypothetical protein
MFMTQKSARGKKTDTNMEFDDGERDNDIEEVK